MKIYLDDIRDLPDETWTLARTYQEAVQLVEQYGFPDEVSFDHDLGLMDYPLTGMDFAHFLIDLDLDSGSMPGHFSFKVHSANPTGAENIRSLMAGYMRFRNAKSSENSR